MQLCQILERLQMLMSLLKNNWLVALGFETVFQSISGCHPERRRKREMIDERKNVQHLPRTPTVSTVGPCPNIIQICRTPGTGSLSSTITLPDQP